MVREIHDVAEEAKTKIEEMADTVRAHLTESPKAAIHEHEAAHTEPVVHAAPAEQDVSPVIRYASETPAETTIQVTYENNAIGDNQESRADKSDLTPD